MKKDIISSKAQYLLGDLIEMRIPMVKVPTDLIEINTYQLYMKIDMSYTYEFKEIAKGKVELIIKIYPLGTGNYGLEVIIGSQLYETAFDVVSKQSDCIRYGFLSDFTSEDNDSSDIEYLTRLHLNAVQFYDWMYTHDHLISKDTLYTDPLGRPTNLDVIKMKIKKCMESGIRPFAYGAVYASSKALFNSHPNWGLYTVDKEPLTFFDWLNFMNIQKDNGWSDYIINQFSLTMKELEFQGIHMDTYGFPKTVCDSFGNTFSLSEVFPDLINRASIESKKINPANGVIFNCVNNWPVEKVASSLQDTIYIEVWPPHDTYFDLYRLIREAKMMSHNFVVLAAYIHPFKDALSGDEVLHAENALLLTNAVINASGGTQLVFGENYGILCDSYYAKYASVSDSFKEKIRDYADYLVRYADLLYKDEGTDVSMTSTDGINEDILFNSSKASFSSVGKEFCVWTIIRESHILISVQLINLVSNNSLWNQPKESSQSIDDIEMVVKINRVVKGIFCASPDHMMKAKMLDFRFEKTSRGREYFVKIPKLINWNTVWIEME
ncbi:MAG: glycoside hydrolase family 66 protein [Candidatus Izemoplasmatales bacterium]|nr:glycoside hydrolase family 66 protein [Candidatus Izemoplasmatales bacterium]